MATITIRDIPEDTHAELKVRAARAGQSLQEYLKGQLVEITRRTDMKALMAKWHKIKQEEQINVSVEDILEARDSGRQ